MKPFHSNRLLGGLAGIALALTTLPAGADIIAADAFNYTPSGASLDGANGGSGSPGWTGPWSADATATVGTGLPYGGYGGLGLGNGATLAGVTIPPGNALTRGIGDSSAVVGNEVWMRVLYSPGSQVEHSPATATPFQLFTASGGFLNLQRTVGAEGEGDPIFALNMSGANAGSATFDLSGSGTRMLLWKLSINQSAGANEILSMWVNPTAITEAGLGTPFASVSANILQGGDDYLSLFSADGLGDRINDLVIGTKLSDVTAVPEASGPMMMLLVSLLATGVIWYRWRQTVSA